MNPLLARGRDRLETLLEGMGMRELNSSPTR